MFHVIKIWDRNIAEPSIGTLQSAQSWKYCSDMRKGPHLQVPSSSQHPIGHDSMSPTKLPSMWDGPRPHSGCPKFDSTWHQCSIHEKRMAPWCSERFVHHSPHKYSSNTVCWSRPDSKKHLKSDEEFQINNSDVDVDVVLIIVGSDLHTVKKSIQIMLKQV